MSSGRIKDYVLYDLDAMPLRDLLQTIAGHVIGLKAINTSWDSGLLTADGFECPVGWSAHQNIAVSPPVTIEMIRHWPLSHAACWDEWWFFREIPSDFDYKHGICNYTSIRIGDWADSEYEGGAQLGANIARFRPTVIIGNGGTCTYCVSAAAIKELESF